jgi:hypothetical protein
MKRIVGIYWTEDNLIHAIRELMNKGYESKDISVISKNKMDFAGLKQVGENIEDEHLLVDIKPEVNDITFGSGVDSFVSTLKGYGISEVEARKYQDAMDQGGIMLLLGFSDVIRGHIENPGTYTHPNIGVETIENPGTINIKEELTEIIETPGTITDDLPSMEDIKTPGTTVDPDQTDEIETPGTINIDDTNK